MAEMTHALKSMTQEGSWHFFPHFLIRNTGMPFEWIEKLGFKFTTQLLIELDRRKRRMDELRATLKNKSFRETVAHEQSLQSEKDILRALLVLRKKVTKSKACPTSAILTIESNHPSLARKLRSWNDAVREYEAVVQDYVSTFNIELADKRRYLSQVINEPDFQHAVFLLSPSIFKHTLRWNAKQPTGNSRKRKLRKAEKQLTAYLQRFCVKNERCSFFGPANYGRFDYHAEEILKFEPPPRMIPQKREVFMSFWGVEAFIECIVGEPEIQPFLQPRQSPMASVVERANGYYHSLASTTSISLEQVEIWRQCDGKRSVKRIAQVLGKKLVDVIDLLRQLTHLKLITCTLDIPPTIARPLKYLRETIAEMPLDITVQSRWLERIDELDRLRVKFREGDLEQRIEAMDQMETFFEKITSQSSQRGAGEFYADRYLFFEECADTLGPFVFGKKFVCDLEKKLSQPITLWASIANIKWQEYQRIGVSLHCKMSPQNQPVSYLKFVNQLSKLEKNGKIATHLENLEHDLRQTISSYLKYDESGHLAVLSSDVLTEMHARAHWVKEKHSLMCAPDIFLLTESLEALRDHQFKVVIGEVHDDWTTIGAGNCAYFHERAQEMRALQEQILLNLPDGNRIATILPRRRHKDYCAEPPGISIELSGRSLKPSEQVIDISNLKVVRIDERVVLIHPRIKSWLCLCTGDVRNLSHWIFSWPSVVPIRLGEEPHTPRIEMNGVILQRERWQIDKEVIAPILNTSGHQLMLEMWRLKEMLGLPEYGFARTDTEVKPVFIDFKNIFLLEFFKGMLSQASRIQFIEMLPGPDRLWLKDRKGRYCCEFRMGVFYNWHDV